MNKLENLALRCVEELLSYAKPSRAKAYRLDEQRLHLDWLNEHLGRAATTEETDALQAKIREMLDARIKSLTA